MPFKTTSYDPVSSGVSFAWAAPFAPAINGITSTWLSQTMVVLRDNARAFCKKKTGISFSTNKYSSNYAALIIHSTGDPNNPMESLTNWAFGGTINIPVGGFKPEPGARGIRMEKPEGEVWRARTWIRRGGERFTPPGFMHQAIAATFTTPRLDALGHPLAQIIATGITLHLQSMYEAKGFNVIVT